jgi:hypothetical protein
MDAPAKTIATCFPPPDVQELGDAVRDFLAALDDPRHPRAYVDLGEGMNVRDRRAKLDAVLARV